MYTEVLGSIDGIAIFPVISLVIFVTFFSGMLVWTLRLRGDRLAMLARMPLDTSDDGPVHSSLPSQGAVRDLEAR